MARNFFLIRPWFWGVLVFALLFTECRSKSASLNDQLLLNNDSEAYLLPTDLLFDSNIVSPGFRRPSTSAVEFLNRALNEPFVYDGFSPLSAFFMPISCDIREDLIPDQQSSSLFLYDVSHRQRVGIWIRYRNHENCGLIVQPKQPLVMDRTYALVMLKSYLWQGKVEQSERQKQVFDRLNQTWQDTKELEASCNRYGLRARETRQALSVLREIGIGTSEILRLGISVVRSQGGLYGPYFAIERRYQLNQPIKSVKSEKIGTNLLRLKFTIADPCDQQPCRISPVYGPGILSPLTEPNFKTIEREILIRLPETKEPKAIIWIEPAQWLPSKNREFFNMSIFGKLSNSADAILAMQIRPKTEQISDRISAIIEKAAISRYLKSITLNDQMKISYNLQKQLPIAQLCFTDYDCIASAALDQSVNAVILPMEVDFEVKRPVFGDGRLPNRNQILKLYANQLSNDLLSNELNRQRIKEPILHQIKKKYHVTTDILNSNQFNELVKFLFELSAESDLLQAQLISPELKNKNDHK